MAELAELGSPGEKTAGDDSAPAPRGFAVRLTLGALGLHAAVMTPVVVTMALRIGEVDPAGKEKSLGLVLGIGAFLAMIANPLFGRLSDRTTSRYGRRRPWLISGSLGVVAGLALVATVDSIPVILAGWCLTQVSYNAALAALMATIPDQVPAPRRGGVSGAMGFSFMAAIMCGSLIIGTVNDVRIQFLAPAVAGTLLITWFTLRLKDRPADGDRPALTLRQFLGSFWTNPLTHRDFGWAWLSRFLMMLAIMTPNAYAVFLLTDRIGVPQNELARTAAALITAGMACNAVVSLLGGWLSDRMGRRKPFVIGGALIATVGLVMIPAAESLAMVFVGTIIFNIGGGVFMSVDMALVTQVLPNDKDAAKDLGVINIANALPQSIGPAIAPLFLAIGTGHNYPALYGFGVVCALLGAFLVTRIRGVR
jgi:MFS family permease